MNRFTGKCKMLDDDLNEYEEYDFPDHSKTFEAIAKLGQLEDIEEELGIDLITLFKALKEGFYFKDEFGDIEHLDKQTLHLLMGKKFQELKEQIKDYGKTWALTKEELKK